MATIETVSTAITEARDRVLAAHPGGRVALAGSTPDGEPWQVDGDQVFHAASTMKTAVMVEVFRQVGQGRFALDDQVVLHNDWTSIVDGSPYSQTPGYDSTPDLYPRIGSAVSLRELTFEMVTRSSNLATNLLIELVGARAINGTLAELGVHGLHVERGIADDLAHTQGRDNRSTAIAQRDLYRAISEGRAISAAASEQMLHILLAQQWRSKIPALLPRDVRVAHKTGSLDGVSHDCGIVLLPDGRRYLLAILSDGLSDDEDSADPALAQLALEIHQILTA